MDLTRRDPKWQVNMIRWLPPLWDEKGKKFRDGGTEYRVELMRAAARGSAMVAARLVNSHEIWDGRPMAGAAESAATKPAEMNDTDFYVKPCGVEEVTEPDLWRHAPTDAETAAAVQQAVAARALAKTAAAEAPNSEATGRGRAPSEVRSAAASG